MWSNAHDSVQSALLLRITTTFRFYLNPDPTEDAKLLNLTSFATFARFTRQLAGMAVLGVAFGWSGLVSAQSDASATPGSQRLVAEIKRVLPQFPVENVFKLPIPDMYGVELTGGQMLYGTADGKYLFSGDLYEVGESIVNLAESRRSVMRKSRLDEVPLEDMVVFAPEGERKTYISVFTDVDCSYCRKLHQEMPAINELGIEVRYLAYPRAGLGTPTHSKMASAWCADNPNDAMTSLKAGRNISSATCDNPTAEQFELGRAVGVTGTPAIVTEDGRLLPGYMPAAALAEALGL